LLFKDYKDTFYNSSRHVTIYSYTIQLITFDILYYKQLLSGFNQVSKTDCWYAYLPLQNTKYIKVQVPYQVVMNQRSWRTQQSFGRL